MPSELDRQYDAVLAKITGPGGPIQIGHDEQGRSIVTNLPATLPSFFDTFCALHSGTVAVIAGTERLTFADLYRLSDEAARALADNFGLRKGDRVAIAIRNAPAWIICYMAIMKVGGIAVLMNGWWESEELSYALNLTEPVLVLADDQRARRIDETNMKPKMIRLDVDQGIEAALAPITSGAFNDITFPAVAPEDDATILFTSGSTGKAKGAVSTHRAVTAGVYGYSLGTIVLKTILDMRGEPPAHPPRTLVAVPLFHVTGEVPVLLNSFVIGRGMVIMRKWDAGEALRLIEAEKVTYFVGVPTMSLELMQHPDRDKYDLSSLTDLAAGGAPRPVSHVQRLRESFKTAQPALGYGLTETNAAGCTNFWQNYADKPASTGRPQRPLVEVAILGEDGSHLPVGQTGEIGIRGACNIKEYWRDQPATSASFTADGFFRTGDLGYLDEDYYLFIVDRLKDIIIRGGENISCQEVEAALYGHEAVLEAAVFAVPDNRLGEVPGAVIYARDKGLTVESLAEHLNGRIAKYKVPAFIWFHDAPLPKLGTGKIDRITLKRQYGEAEAQPV